jgi:uncharacterized protein YqgV (UPF0045/DUF77 family)
MVEIAGKKINNWWLVGGAAGVAVVFYLYKQSEGSSSSTAATSDNSSSIDPVTGLPYSQDNQVDPATGMTYLQEAQEYGSVSAAEAAVSSGSYYGAEGYGYAGQDTGYPTGYYGYGNTGYSYASNAQWSQAVTAGLTALGYSATDISAALGLYFQSMPLSASQAAIIQAAIAEYGPPPQGSYPIIQQGSNPTTNPTVTVPNVIGQDVTNAQQNLSEVGLKSTLSGPPTTVEGEVREVSAMTPSAGSKVNDGTTIKLTYKIANPPAVNNGKVSGK